MKNLLIRIVIAALCVVMLMLILPLFLSVIGLEPTGQLVQLLRLVVACLAVIYVIWGPSPPVPW